MSTTDSFHFALSTSKNEIVSIYDVRRSGRGDFVCSGCRQPMQAIVRHNNNFKPYFRHDPANRVKVQCHWKDETYLHKLGKEILQRIKRIKVPRIMKYANTKDYPPIKLRGADFISAHRVEIELPFYQTYGGEVRWGRTIDPECLELIRPDVTFFNRQNEPILLIELLVTHKVPDEKLAIIHRLGIDCIEVELKPGTDHEIEKKFNTTSNTYWLYNNIEQRTKYEYKTQSTRNSISEVDPRQRRLLEETKACRKARIANLIREIERFMESEDFKCEEQEIKVSTARMEQSISKFKCRAKKEIREKFKGQEEHLKQKASELQEYHSKLEGRYIAKRSELEHVDSELRSKIDRVELTLGKEARDYVQARSRFEGEMERIGERRRELLAAEEELRRDKEQEKSVLALELRVEEEEERQRDREIGKRREELPKKYKRIEGELRRQFGGQAELKRRLEFALGYIKSGTN